GSGGEPASTRPANMTGSPESVRYRRNRAFALIAGISVAVLGVIALTGWLLDGEMFKRIIPGSAPLKPNIAAGFLLCGVGLALLSGKKSVDPVRICAVALAVIVTALGALTLREYFYNWNLGIDTRLVSDFTTKLGAY